jgi:phospholipase C
VNSDGQIIGMWNGFCSPTYGSSCSGNEYVVGIPYGNQTEDTALFFEDGFKQARGALLEGHYLVFEANGHALANPAVTGQSQLSAMPAAAAHDDPRHRWVLHALAAEGTHFNVTSAVDGRYISQHTSLAKLQSGAEVYNITYLGSKGYALQKENGQYLNVNADGSISIDSKPVPYSAYSVTYH